jgi:hypothetical protein
MPAYPGNSQAILLRNNRQGHFWNNETVPANTLSRAFQLERINRSSYPWGCSFEAFFGGIPGAFEIDIMGANMDVIQNYVSLGTITAVNSYNVGRWDMPSNMWPKYVAAFVKTLTNAVGVTVQVTR